MTCRSHLPVRAAAGLAAVLALITVGVRPAVAHDVPDELVFYAHVAPAGDRLHVPLRVPLVWLADYDFPLRDRGYIELGDGERLDAELAVAAVHIAADIALFEDGARLQPDVVGWRLSLPSDRSFDDYHHAVASIAGPRLPPETNLFWNQGFLDVHFVYPIDAQGSTFSLLVDSPGLAERLHVLTTFVAPDGTSRTYDLLGTMGRVELNPGVFYLVRLFTAAGLTNLLTGWEHVLFIVALALALARRPAGPLRPIVAFGVVASLVVFASGASAGIAGLNSTFAEVLVMTAVAASLLMLAVGNVMARSLQLRWLTAALCAVPHGLLLAGGLEPLLQFRSTGAVLPLVAYVVGALAGVAAVFGIALGAGWLVTRHAGARRHGPVVAALLIGYVGWRDTLARGEVLLTVGPPPLDQATLMALGRWAAVVFLVVAALWLAFELFADRRGAAGQALRETADWPETAVEGGAREPGPLDARGDGQEPPVAAGSGRRAGGYGDGAAR